MSQVLHSFPARPVGTSSRNYYIYQCCHTQGVQQPHSFHSAREIDDGNACPGVQMLAVRIVDSSQRFFILDELLSADENAEEKW